MRCHINMSQYIRKFICIEIYIIRFENLHEVVRIDNIWSASDHGMNHICKLVIESETLAVFVWRAQKEFHQMSTTCNYLEDGIWIANDVQVLECSNSMAVTISRMYVASLGLGKIQVTKGVRAYLWILIKYLSVSVCVCLLPCKKGWGCLFLSWKLV